MNNPAVSISCITYNHARYIRQCLSGFMMQECNFDFEVLIHDDASTDGTREIIREYQEKYPDIIKPILQTENQWSKGVRGINFKFNFSRAKGKYIAICEGDDYWTDRRKLQKQFDVMEANSRFSLCTHDFIIKYEHKEIADRQSSELFRYLTQSPLDEPNNLYSISLMDFCIHLDGLHTATNFFRSCLLGGNVFERYSQVTSGDYLLKLILLKEGDAVFINESMSVLRKNASGVTQQPRDSFLFFYSQKRQFKLFIDIVPTKTKRFLYKRLWMIFPNFLTGRKQYANLPFKQRIKELPEFIVTTGKYIFYTIIG